MPQAIEQLKIEQLKTDARKNNIPIMKDDTANFICEYIITHNVKTILEIGTAVGYSAIQFALAKEDIFVSTIEYDIERYQIAVKNVAKCGLQDRITLYLGDALTTDISGSFDLIFIDGAKAQYTKFFEKFKYQLNDGGVIITDNLSFHGMVENPSLTHNYSTKKLVHKIQKFIDFLTLNEEFKTEYFELGDKIAVSRRNTEPKKDIFETLIEIGIHYELQLHPAIFNEADAIAVESNPETRITLPGQMVKNLFLREQNSHNWQNSNATMILVSLPLNKRCDLKQIAKIFGTKRLTFCNPDELAEFLNITPGSVSPLCIMNDKLHKVLFLIDEDLRGKSENNCGSGLTCGNILIHPLRNDATISIAFDDLIRFTQYFDHDYKIEKLIDKGDRQASED